MQFLESFNRYSRALMLSGTAALSLGACATTGAPPANAASNPCAESTSTNRGILVFRNTTTTTTLNATCQQAQVLEAIATMAAANNDIELQALVVQTYYQSADPAFRRFMDEALRERNYSITDLRANVEVAAGVTVQCRIATPPAISPLTGEPVLQTNVTFNCPPNTTSQSAPPPVTVRSPGNR